MTYRLFAWLAAGLGSVVLAAAEPAQRTGAPLSARLPVLDPARLLADGGGPTAAELTTKLSELERRTGLQVLLRFHAQSPSAEEDKVPGAYMQSLAKQLGTARAGVLMVYFADEDDWRVWIGDDLTARFVGRPGTAKEFTESGAMHEAKEEFLKKALAAADATFKARQAKAPVGEADAKALRRGLQAEALIDGLAGKLGVKQ